MPDSSLPMLCGDVGFDSLLRCCCCRPAIPSNMAVVLLLLLFKLDFKSIVSNGVSDDGDGGDGSILMCVPMPIAERIDDADVGVVVVAVEPHQFCS